MADTKSHIPSLRFAAIFSQQVSAIDWAVQQCSQQWGAVVKQTKDLAFDVTSFYDESMGDQLWKRLVAFEGLVDPTQLVDSKLLSNRWENEFRDQGNDWVTRPLNIDPGYLTEAKVVLMTTKDRDHRIYIDQGIYAEITLTYLLPGKWVAHRWTYPDYRNAVYHDFFFECRDYLRNCLQQQNSTN